MAEGCTARIATCGYTVADKGDGHHTRAIRKQVVQLLQMEACYKVTAVSLRGTSLPFDEV